MKMVKCAENHFYDSDKYTTCPLCEKNKRKNEKTESTTRIVKLNLRAAKKKPAEVKKPEPKPEQKPADNRKPDLCAGSKKYVDKTPEAKPDAPKTASPLDTEKSEEIASIIKEAVAAPQMDSISTIPSLDELKRSEKKTEPKEVKFPEKKPEPPKQERPADRKQQPRQANAPGLKAEVVCVESDGTEHKPEKEDIPQEIVLEDNRRRGKPAEKKPEPVRAEKSPEKKPEPVKAEKSPEKKPEPAKAESPAEKKPAAKITAEQVVSELKELGGIDEADVENIVIDDINNMAINSKTGTLVKYIGTTEAIKIPDSITTIGKYAFRGNETLRKIVMADSVKIVDKFAFCHCFALEEIVLSNNLESIGENAFLKCLKLKSISFPESLKRIGKGAFGRCNALENIVLPAYLQRISDLTFFSCRRLRRVVIGGSVESIGNSAFSECYNLKKVVISDAVASIGESAFSWCRSLDSITIPSTVKSIGNWAFYGCQNLSTLRISWQTKDIKEDAFTGCESLYTINITEFENPDIKMDEIKKGHRQTVRVLRQVNRKKAESYAKEHGVSMLFM